jgi:hypothetical protein
LPFPLSVRLTVFLKVGLKQAAKYLVGCLISQIETCNGGTDSIVLYYTMISVRTTIPKENRARLGEYVFVFITKCFFFFFYSNDIGRRSVSNFKRIRLPIWSWDVQYFGILLVYKLVTFLKVYLFAFLKYVHENFLFCFSILSVKLNIF